MVKEKKKEEMFTIIVDTREKKAWWNKDQADFNVKNEKLDTGDYTIEELSDILTIERKGSVGELYSNFTSGRERFYREIDRMKKFPLRFLIVEANWSDVINPFSYRTSKAMRVRAAAIVRSSIFNLMALHGIQVMFVGDRGKYIVKHLLCKIYEYHLKGKLDHE